MKHNSAQVISHITQWMCLDINSCTLSPSLDCRTGPAATSKNSNGGLKTACNLVYKGNCSFTI